MIKVVSFTTKNYSEILEKALIPSYNKIYKDKKIKIRFDTTENMPFNLAGQTHNLFFKQIMVAKIEYYLECLKKWEGEKILCLDGDTIILQDFEKNLCSILDKYDVAHQDGAIIAFNSNKKVIEWFEEFVNTCIANEDPPDGFPEFEFQEYLQRKSNLSITRLPEEYGYLNSDSYMYHATNGGSTNEEKICVLHAAHIVFSQAQDKKIANCGRFKKFIKNKNNTLCSHGFVSFKEDNKHVDFKLRPSKEVNFDTFCLERLHNEDVFVQVLTSWDYIEDDKHYEDNMTYLFHPKKLYCVSNKPGKDPFFDME